MGLYANRLQVPIKELSADWIPEEGELFQDSSDNLYMGDNVTASNALTPINGWGGGSSGGSAGLQYVFNTATDPATGAQPGCFCLNNATVGSATKMYVSKLGNDSESWEGFLELVTSGVVTVYWMNLSAQAVTVFAITGMVETLNYFEFDVTYEGGQLPTGNCYLGFSPVALTNVGSAFSSLPNPSAVRYPRINADNTVTALTAAQLASDLVPATVAIRTGSALAFDVPAVYNTATAPSSGTVTLDLTGAVAGVEVVAYFNHGTVPSWPSGITAVGQWNNAALNIVRFIFIDASNISASINSANVPVEKWTTVSKAANTTRTGTTSLVADPDLKVPIVASGNYWMKFVIMAATTVAGDLKYRITGPAGGGGFIKPLHTIATGTAPADTARSAYDASDIVFAATGTGLITMEITCRINNSTNAGDVSIEWAQNTSDAGNTTFFSGSYVEYFRIS